MLISLGACDALTKEVTNKLYFSHNDFNYQIEFDTELKKTEDGYTVISANKGFAVYMN
ncbi:MAG: hypothetical protein IKJ00_06525 [Clostridia bacterium]|nr:hypothetical protein [Clostridia bacterium]